MQQNDIFATFERFKTHLPIGGDLVLMILKGHLLIEEQVALLVQNRIAKPEALNDAKLTVHQKICLAQALVAEVSPGGEEDWLWPAVRKMNKLRNDIAHSLSDTGISDRIEDFVKRVPKKLEGCNLCHRFEFALWITCSAVHLLTIAPDPTDFADAPEPELDPSDFAEMPVPEINPNDFSNVP